QIYGGLEILTGVASAEERRRLEHRLVSFLAPSESFSAGRYAQLAHHEIDSLLERGARPLVVGGTGLYLRAALADLAMRPPPPLGVRERLLDRLRAEGPRALHGELARAAPALAAPIDPNDRQRIVRTLELLESAPERALAQAGRSGASQLWTAEMRHRTLLAGLIMERAALYARIDARVDEMVGAGAIDEVRRAARGGAGPSARKALGFAELLAGDVEAMKRRSRNYARRQLTWMRKLAGVQMYEVGALGVEECAAAIAADAGYGRPRAPGA
ncbi:MAG: tRNA (adenosine(37)-N6)-dimethylallyltransferase MiaA, partial [Acidobacteriota bacterium]|nr:tRNA (adenosine(37)-N6)-dimethylallyltransferase MiaA [Acidobacteriota bacterium]